MKKLPFFLFLTLLTSCGDRKKNDQDNISSTTQDHVSTKYINSTEIACNYSGGKKNFESKNINGEIVSGILQTKLDIIIPYKLSNKIISELKRYREKNSKLTAKNFWNSLSKAGRLSLNNYLLEKYGTQNNENFNLKRKLIAYAFTINTELEQNKRVKKKFKQAIRFKSNNHKEFQEFTIAFSDDIREIVDLEVCNIHEIDNIKVPNDTLLPSNILTNVVCQQFDTKNKIVFKMYDDKIFNIDIHTENMIDQIVINSDNIKSINAGKYQTYKYSDPNYKFSIQIKENKTNNGYYSYIYESYINNTIDHLNFEIKKQGHSKLKLKRFDCVPIKPFTI